MILPASAPTDNPLAHLADIQLLAAWAGMGLGVLAGAGLGVFFHRDDWLGGYGSYPRRMARLGHIALFGLAFLNLAFTLTCRTVPLDPAWAQRGAWALLVAAATMPACCFLSAWRKPLRHLFPVPVAAAALGIASVLLGWP